MFTLSANFRELRPRHFTFAAFGTRGDIFPMLAVADALSERGHRVTFAAPERFRSLIESRGLSYANIRPNAELSLENPLAHGVPEEKLNSEFALRRLIFPFVEDTYRDLLEAGADADMLVFPMYVFPGEMAAERLSIPYTVVHFAPASINSSFDPPYLPQLPWLYPLQRRWPVLSRLLRLAVGPAIRSWSAPMRALREQEGFAEDNRDLIFNALRSPWLNLALFSSCIGGMKPDWPKPTVLAGFPFLEELPGREHEELELFLNEGGPPVIATLGSVSGRSSRDFFIAIVEATKRLGRRLVLIAGAETEVLKRQVGSASVFVVDYVPYSLLFRRACALVISGSVGPLSHALQAGRPFLAIAVPKGIDQFDNALRAVRLGVARWRVLGRCGVEEVTADLQTLLTDPLYAENAARWAAIVRAEHGVVNACEALESVLQATSELEPSNAD
jgi:rhamnosyltransferase subunit B